MEKRETTKERTKLFNRHLQPSMLLAAWKNIWVLGQSWKTNFLLVFSPKSEVQSWLWRRLQGMSELTSDRVFMPCTVCDGHAGLPAFTTRMALKVCTGVQHTSVVAGYPVCGSLMDVTMYMWDGFKNRSWTTMFKTRTQLLQISLHVLSHTSVPLCDCMSTSYPTHLLSPQGQREAAQNGTELEPSFNYWKCQASLKWSSGWFTVVAVFCACKTMLHLSWVIQTVFPSCSSNM